eukprot:g2698.t1
MEPGSVEEHKFDEEACEMVAHMVYTQLYYEKNESCVGAEQQKLEDKELATLKAQVHVKDRSHGSIILHLEFTDSKLCGAEQAVRYYYEAVQASARQESADGDDALGFMPAATMQLLNKLGVLEAFAAPLRELEHNEQVTIWKHGNDEVACTIVRTLGKGAQGYVYETISGGDVTQALKWGSFSSMKNEALIFLKANYPKSHPNVLRVSYVHALDQSNELLCLMEKVEGPTKGVRDLEQAIDSGLLFEGTDEVVSARLIAFTLQLALALEYLHTLGIVHQDVKPANNLIDASDPDHWRLVLIDFGISSIGKCDGGGRVANAELRGCTPAFCGPEQHLNFEQARETGEKQQCTHSTDVFCFVTTVLEMYAGSIDGKWRGHQPFRMLLSRWANPNDLPQLPPKETLHHFDKMPCELRKVLHQAVVTPEITMNGVVDKLLSLNLAGVAVQRPARTEGIDKHRVSLMYDRVGAALYDQGAHDESLNVFELAINVHGDDARTQNNLGAVKLMLGKPEEAKSCFDEAHRIYPDHKEATFNAGLLQPGSTARPQLDRSGAAGAVEDNRGKVDLANALIFAPGQQLEVYYGDGKWEQTDASDLKAPVIELAYRLPPQLAPNYSPQQLLLVQEDGKWLCKRAQETIMRLDSTNHAPVLFADLTAINRAQRAYTNELNDKHAFILDLFSGQKLGTRTQTATLEYHDADAAAEIMSKDDDVDSESYQKAQRVRCTGIRAVKAPTLLDEMLSHKARLVQADNVAPAAATGDDSDCLLILGSAASGKTTLLETFIMEMVHLEFTDSKLCGAEQAVRYYYEAVQASARQESADGDDALGFMPAATMQLLNKLGVLEAFAAPLRELEHNEQVTIWKHGNDEVACTIVRTLGKGAQGYVYETISGGDVTQALKWGSFSSMKNEALIFLKANYPKSHPNVLRVSYVHALDQSNELLCLMEKVEGPTKGVRDLEQAIDSGLLFEGTDEVVSARLIAFTLQLALALEYLHTLGIVHQDVKPANNLIDASDPDHWRLVLIDFGISSIGKCDGGGRVANAELRGCTPAFCGPEQHLNFEQARET